MSAHGTRSCYVQGCRCGDCAEAARLYTNAWRNARRQAKTHRLLHGRWIKLPERREKAS